MQGKVQKTSTEQSFTTCEKDKVYAKFRALGANVDRLKELGFAIQELEQLLERLEEVHDKKLVHFITTLRNIPRSESRSYSEGDSSSKILARNCPRCTRELTNANIIKENTSHLDDMIAFVLVCECGYIRELRNQTELVHQRQSTLPDYVCI
jgi:hypothetical protein